jgi:dTMP kinase
MDIISVEGLDKSGKKTQTQMLVDFLRAKRFKVAVSESPNYVTPTGELIRQWLAKDYDVDQRTIEFVYTANMQEQQAYFKKLEEEDYDFLVMDRYTGSQRAYAVATGSAPEWVDQMQKYMRQPDVEIIIDIDPMESMRRKGKHNNGVNDRYEENLKLLYHVRELYLQQKRHKIIVNGMQSIENIHQDIIMVMGPIVKRLYEKSVQRLVEEVVTNATKEK